MSGRSRGDRGFRSGTHLRAPGGLGFRLGPRRSRRGDREGAVRDADARRGIALVAFVVCFVAGLAVLFPVLAPVGAVWPVLLVGAAGVLAGLAGVGAVSVWECCRSRREVNAGGASGPRGWSRGRGGLPGSGRARVGPRPEGGDRRFRGVLGYGLGLFRAVKRTLGAFFGTGEGLIRRIRAVAARKRASRARGGTGDLRGSRPASRPGGRGDRRGHRRGPASRRALAHADTGHQPGAP